MRRSSRPRCRPQDRGRMGRQDHGGQKSQGRKAARRKRHHHGPKQVSQKPTTSKRKAPRKRSFFAAANQPQIQNQESNPQSITSQRASQYVFPKLLRLPASILLQLLS